MRTKKQTVVALERELAREIARAARAEIDRERLAHALDAFEDGVVVVDEKGVEVRRNPAAERFRAGRHGAALAEEGIGELLEQAREGVAQERELLLFGPPREALLLRGVPLVRDGVTVGAAAFVRDITELRRVESVRRDFVANVSHELKTPIGAMELLAETVASSDDIEVMRRLSEQLAREADRLARIVDDLLDLSLIEAQEAPTRDRIPVRVVVDEAVERVRSMALARNITLRVGRVTGDLAIDCDPAQVVSAVTNLLDNAIKYSEDGQRVEISAARDGDRVVIAVRDEGVGIPSRDLERIFERFYRVDKARSRATGGTGLGLSIVRHVAQAHGGEVAVESIEGEGSTFRFILPLADNANGVSTAHPPPGVSASGNGTGGNGPGVPNTEEV
ncbi:MAG TPA: ATP-binding protein [Acidimicrobiia bacterium]|nr:ATP-binding protein [Acidimicrobiia bacterium]